MRITVSRCLVCCLQVQSLESDKLSSMGDLQHASLQKVQKEGAPGHCLGSPTTRSCRSWPCQPGLLRTLLVSPLPAAQCTEGQAQDCFKPHLPHPGLTDTTRLPASLFCVAAPLFTAPPPAALREVASASWRLLAAIVSIQGRLMRCNLEPLHKFTQWVAQQRAANMFRGQVAGPLGVEIKLKSRINGRALDRNWVANLEQVRGGQCTQTAALTTLGGVRLPEYRERVEI